MDSPCEDNDYNDENDAGCDEDDTLISEDNDYNDDHQWPWWEWLWVWWQFLFAHNEKIGNIIISSVLDINIDHPYIRGCLQVGQDRSCCSTIILACLLQELVCCISQLFPTLWSRFLSRPLFHFWLLLVSCWLHLTGRGGRISNPHWRTRISPKPRALLYFGTLQGGLPCPQYTNKKSHNVHTPNT